MLSAGESRRGNAGTFVSGRERGMRMGRKGLCGNCRILLLFYCVIALTLFLTSAAAAQSNEQLPDGPKPQNNAPQPVPETPKPQENAPPLPEAPAAQPAPEPQPAPNAPIPGSEPAGSATSDDTLPTTGSEDSNAGQKPSSQVTTIAPGSVPRDGSDREQMYKITRQVNAVTVPVTVKDDSGHLVEGLLAKDFSVYEDGVRQKLTFFTSDPFPLSAAVVIDMGMPDNVLSKVRDTLPALVGAFGQFDEISVYSYGNTVKKWQDFTSAKSVPPSLMKQLKAQRGSAAGTPVIGGPMGQTGPVINGRNVADNTPNMPSMPSGTNAKTSRVLNDAILAAARDLAARDGVTRRRILFVVSDGREVGSDASYADVMKVLLSNGITVYAVGVGSAGIPGYRTLEKIHIPGTSYGNILPKYVSATGGQLFPSFDEQAIENAYSQVTEQARNQYTLVYQTRATPSSAYRSIEVRVTRGGLRIYAKDGYYPLPPRRVPAASSVQP